MKEKDLQYKASAGEWEILQVLWESQPCTVKEIHEQLAQKKEVGYTTILKQLQRMATKEKGLVKREKKGKLHYYEAVPNKAQVQISSYTKLVDTIFKGSSMNLVMHALGKTKASAEELEELQQWLDQQKEQNND